MLDKNDAGLGFRRSMLSEVAAGEADLDQVDFFEVAPENWMQMGGRFNEHFSELTQAHKFIAHGLSLSIGSCDPLDLKFIKQLKAFFEQHNIELYSEHLSYCSSQGHMYDLMPIPFTQEAVMHVAARIRQVSEILERSLVIENVSFYAMQSHELTELQFLQAVLQEADCNLLLDVNNVYVNSINHGFDARNFISQLPGERITYLHIAGHYQQVPDLIIDSHGAEVVDPVWQLLQHTYKQFGVLPTLLERDFNIPPFEQLLSEVNQIRQIQQGERYANAS